MFLTSTQKASIEIDKIMKANNLTTETHISFPQYKILPEEVKLALRILQNNGMKIEFILKPKIVLPYKSNPIAFK